MWNLFNDDEDNEEDLETTVGIWESDEAIEERRDAFETGENAEEVFSEVEQEVIASLPEESTPEQRTLRLQEALN